MTLFAPAQARWFQLLLLLAVAVTSWQTLTPSPVPLPGVGSDKLAHTGAFLALAFLVDAAWPTRAIGWRALALLAAYGAGIEIAQGYVPNRFTSAMDLIANLTGLILYAGLLGPWLRKRFTVPSSPAT